MSGKPAARMGDMTKYGGPIVQGSMGVMIGAPTGVACSVCPGGTTSGNPVNPLLGAKVQPGETDVALPGPLPFVLSRSYSSYRTKTPAPVGLFGPGWKAPFDIRVQIRDDELILNDNGGRSIHFDPLLPGETAFSRSESLWLARGGALKLHESNVLHVMWQTLPEALRLSPHLYLATNSAQGPWWILGWPERVPGTDEALPAPLPPYRVLTGLADRVGRCLSFHRDADGDFTGHITGVTDGAGRRFRLALSTQAQRTEAARKQAATSGIRVPEYPQMMPVAGFGTDSGIRLDAVWLVHDPAYPDNLPVRPLVRYTYSPHGELVAVYDRSGTVVRNFTYDDKHPGRMTAHRYAGRPPVTYRYDTAGRVVEQHNPAGLSYTYGYEKNHVVITDSLHRREVLHTEGEGGLKRVVREEKADGSTLSRGFDNAGRLVAQTDAAGRRTEYRLNVGSGNVTEVATPDGRRTEFYYNSQRQLTSTVYPDGLRSRSEYDAPGRLIAQTSRNGDVTRHEYAGAQSDWPCATQNPTGSRHEMTRSRYGQLLTLTDCSGYETRYEYDRFGQLTATHQEEGLSLYRTYDNRGRLVSQRDASGQETRYEYNDAGDLTAVLHPDGSRTETRYDAAGRPVSTTQGGLTRQMEYDAAGRLTGLVNENGSRTTFSYDVLDRLTQETGFDGRTQCYRYNLTGQLIHSEDEGLVTRWHYDASDRLSHRTVNDEPAEQWHYNDRGWLAGISHLSDGHRVSVHYDYDDHGRLCRERQTVHAPDTQTLLWQHATQHDYRNGLAERTTPDRLPPVAWHTYGSGHLAGMKFGDSPPVSFTRDRLHRETQRDFGAYEQNTRYSASGQLLGHTLSDPLLNREYGYNDTMQLVRIRQANADTHYEYDTAGRLQQSRSDTQPAQDWFTDPAGNRLADRHAHPALPAVWRNNRISEDAENFYHHDSHGRLTGRDERLIRDGGSLCHRYHYDRQHRLVQYVRMQQDSTLTTARYLYDPLGRRTGKMVRETPRDGSPERVSRVWYGWDGDRLTTTQTDITRIQTVYLPGSFTPLLRIETTAEELQKATRRSLAEKLQQDGGVTFPPELVALLDGLEGELLSGDISEQSQQWLAQCGLTAERMRNQLEPVHTPQRILHLYHCDHRGLPLALINAEGHIDWSAEYDVWGSLLSENNPHHLQQHLRLPGQQYDEETGLHYNRHRYYNPRQGRYITQDPIGLRGGWNTYVYPLDPVQFIDPLGLNACDLAPEPTALCGNPLFTGGMGPNKMLNELGPKGGFNGSGTILGTGVIGGGIVGATKGQVDNAGRSVNPLADILTQEHKSGINPGGNCTPDELDKLQKQKDAFCNMPRSCSKNDSKFDLINKMNINLACAHTRKNINNKCFSGGDKTHMDQENDAFKSSVNCRGLLNGIK